MTDQRNANTTRGVTDADVQPDGRRSAERRSRLIWPGMVIGLLGLQIVLCAVAVTLAVSDPKQAVVPNYYQRAVDWDEHRQPALPQGFRYIDPDKSNTR